MIITRKAHIDPGEGAPELKTNDGRLITNLTYQPLLENGEINGYPYKGLCRKEQGISIECRWNLRGLTQLEAIRKAGLDEYDTPHLDMDRATFLWVTKKTKSLSELKGAA